MADLGNFIGKCFRQLGLSHGHKGLYLKLREPNGNLIDSVLVSTDHDKALQFIGLDPEEFKRGFETNEDVFRFVQKSPYFNPENYLLQNVSSIGRIRDKKRPSYKEFLKFNESYTGPRFQKVPDKNIFLPAIFKEFPGTRERVNEALAKYALKRLISSRFNGDIVKFFTGLEDKELGIFMQHLKSLPLFSPEVIALSSPDSIIENIKSEYEKYKTNQEA